MLQPFNPPRVSPLMEAYIQRRVGQRAAYISGYLNVRLEVSKPPILVMIEDKYRTQEMQRINKRP